MRHITITLPDSLYAELEVASAGVRDLTFSPAIWAAEAVESALATRRLPQVRLRLRAEDALGRKAVSVAEDADF